MVCFYHDLNRLLINTLDIWTTDALSITVQLYERLHINQQSLGNYSEILWYSIVQKKHDEHPLSIENIKVALDKIHVKPQTFS